MYTQSPKNVLDVGGEIRGCEKEQSQKNLVQADPMDGDASRGHQAPCDSNHGGKAMTLVIPLQGFQGTQKISILPCHVCESFVVELPQ